MWVSSRCPRKFKYFGEIMEHKERHDMLHKCLDELLADFIMHNPDVKRPTQIPIEILIMWSYEQTKNPTSPNRYYYYL